MLWGLDLNKFFNKSFNLLFTMFLRLWSSWTFLSDEQGPVRRAVLSVDSSCLPVSISNYNVSVNFLNAEIYFEILVVLDELKDIES